MGKPLMADLENVGDYTRMFVKANVRKSTVKQQRIAL